jgi:hypothetical protein
MPLPNLAHPLQFPRFSPKHRITYLALSKVADVRRDHGSPQTAIVDLIQAGVSLSDLV